MIIIPELCFYCNNNDNEIQCQEAKSRGNWRPFIQIGSKMSIFWNKKDETSDETYEEESEEESDGDDGLKSDEPGQKFDVFTIDELNEERKEQVKDDKKIELQPDFVAPKQQEPKKSKMTKFRTIYIKNMQSKLPQLKWLPGELLFFIHEKDNTETIEKFRQSVERFKVVSLMIYCVANPKYEIVSLSLSTPLITLYLDLKPQIQRQCVSIPSDLVKIISASDVTVVFPGKIDWYYERKYDHYLMLKDINRESLELSKIVYLDDYYKILSINDSGKDICLHLKLIYWLFQIKFDAQLHGNYMSLSAMWKNLFNFYGKLLIYLYWGLEKKRIYFEKNKKNGVDIRPYYLEDLLIDYGIVTDMSKEQLRQKLIENRKYPEPPLPNLPVSKK